LSVLTVYLSIQTVLAIEFPHFDGVYPDCGIYWSFLLLGVWRFQTSIFDCRVLSGSFERQFRAAVSSGSFERQFRAAVSSGSFERQFRAAVSNGSFERLLQSCLVGIRE
jgi:hypothetical protein